MTPTQPFPPSFEQLLQCLTCSTCEKEQLSMVIQYAIRSPGLFQDCLKLERYNCDLLKTVVSRLSIEEILLIIQQKESRRLRTAGLQFLIALEVSHPSLASACSQLPREDQLTAVNYLLDTNEARAFKYVLFMLRHAKMINNYLKEPSTTETHAVAIMRLLFCHLKGIQLFTKIYFTATDLAELIFLANQKLQAGRAQFIIAQIARRLLPAFSDNTLQQHLIPDIKKNEDDRQTTFLDFACFDNIIAQNDFGFDNVSLEFIEKAIPLDPIFDIEARPITFTPLSLTDNLTTKATIRR